MIKKYILYILRWESSTIILAPIMYLLTGYNAIFVAIIANFCGALIFFWVDRIIFKPKVGKFIYWEIEDNGTCIDCGYQGEVRRVVINKRYDRQFAKKQFRCKDCSQKKLLVNNTE